jgi:Zinc finger, C3HC4 type (RING finger)
MADSVPIAESDYDADCCPICLQSIADSHATSERGSLQFVYSRSCGHMFCLACIQQLLLAPSLSKRTAGGDVYFARDDTTSPVDSVITTTQGVCPMCRADISYFELFSCYYEKGSVIKTNDSVVASDPVPDVLCNSVFSQKEQTEGLGFKITFPSTFETNGEHIFVETSSPVTIPIMKFHYLSATHTLFFMGNGTVFPDGDYGVGIRMWITFSDNFQFITHGVVCLTDVLQSSAGVNTNPVDHDVQAVYQFALGGSNDPLVCRCLPDSDPHRDIPKAPCYNEASLWGNVFCQDFKVGMASYHFLPGAGSCADAHILGEAYISYEHATTAGWPPLDNGRPIPSRVKFRNISSPDPHIFRASICWLQDYNTTWQGASRWDYEMKFDTAYLCIISGTVHSVVIDEDVDKSTVNETIIKMSSYGTELDYINAGLFDEFRRKFTSGVLDDEATRSPTLGVIDRLVREGAPGSIMADIFLVRNVSEMVAPGENGDGFNPIDLRYFYS